MPLWIIVPAAGVGERMGGQIPKQYMMIGNQCMLQHTLVRLLDVPDVAGIVVSLANNDTNFAELPAAKNSRVHAIEGGQTRADSVVSGLQYVMRHAPEDTWVLVHDAARPLIQISDIKRLTDAVFNSGAVGGILGTPVQDTLKRADEYCCIERTVSRQGLWQAQTPQLFRVGELFKAMQSAGEVHAISSTNSVPTPEQSLESPPELLQAEHRPLHQSEQITDEASAMESLGHEPLLVEALQPNLKITRPADMGIAQALLQAEAALR